MHVFTNLLKLLNLWYQATIQVIFCYSGINMLDRSQVVVTFEANSFFWDLGKWFETTVNGTEHRSTAFNLSSLDPRHLIFRTYGGELRLVLKLRVWPIEICGFGIPVWSIDINIFVHVFTNLLKGSNFCNHLNDDILSISLCCVFDQILLQTYQIMIVILNLTMKS